VYDKRPRESGPGLGLIRAEKSLAALRDALKGRHYARRTIRVYLGWAAHFLRHHDRDDPMTLGLSHVNAFLSDLAIRGNSSASTQNQAASALAFYFKHVIGKDLGHFEGLLRARRGKHLPVVLERQEVRAVLDHLDMPYRLIGLLLYGSGLRLHEAMTLRIQDVEVTRREIMVREAKGGNDRVTMLAEHARPPMEEWIQRRARIHTRDVEAGAGWTDLPAALLRKYPSAGRELGWQWLFPGTRLLRLPGGRRGRAPLHDSAMACTPTSWVAHLPSRARLLGCRCILVTGTMAGNADSVASTELHGRLNDPNGAF
jgi:integrase